MNKEKSVLLDYIDACELIKETEEDIRKLRKEKAILQQRKENTKRIKLQAEEIMNSASSRMQRIIRLKVIHQKKWDEVAAKIGGKCTADSIRMEFQRYLEEK